MVSLPSAISEKKAPPQSIERKIQLKPITRPCRFHISRYGGSNPTARRTAATIPMTRMGASFPSLYMGFDRSVSTERREGGVCKTVSYRESEYQRRFHTGKDTGHANAGCACFPDRPFASRWSVHITNRLARSRLVTRGGRQHTGHNGGSAPS